MKYIEKYSIDFPMNERIYRDDDGNFSNDEIGVWWSDGAGGNAFAIFDDKECNEILINPKFNKYNTNVYFFVGQNGGFFIRFVKDKKP